MEKSENKKKYAEFILSLKFLEKNLNIVFNSNDECKRWKSHKKLNEYQNKKDSWKIIYHIFQSENLILIFFGINLLQFSVTYFWSQFLEKDKKKVQNFISKSVFELTRSFKNKKENKFILTKLNIILIKIICKNEKKKIFLFLFDLLKSAKKNEFICKNNIEVFLIFFEEIFSDISNSNLKNHIQNDYRFEEFLKELKNLCLFVLQKSHFFLNSYFNLIIDTLKTLKNIIQFSFFDFSFESVLFEILIILCGFSKIRIHSLDCIIEIFKKKNIFIKLISLQIMENFIIQFQENFILSNNWLEILLKINHENDDFLFKSAAIFSLFLKNFFFEIKNMIFKKGFFILLFKLITKLSCLPELKFFKICLDFWDDIVSFLLVEEFFKIFELFQKFFFLDLKIILIGRMIKPEEVFIEQNINGNLIKEVIFNTNTRDIYLKQKKIFITLTNIDPNSTKFVILEKIQRQFIDKFWNHNILNSLCWSIGSLSEILSNESENQFLVEIVKNLLYLCEKKKGKNNKAIIAGCIMQVVGKFPQFLKFQWKFLKAVIQKLFEFMHETHPGVQDMACDTFLKIGKTCSEKILNIQESEKTPMIEDILNNLVDIIKNLEIRQTQEFFKAIAIIILEVENEKRKNLYVVKIFQASFLKLFFKFKENILKEDTKFLGETINLIRLNIEISKILQRNYFFQIKTIFKETFFLYEWSSRQISKLVFLNNYSKDFYNSIQYKILNNLRNEMLGIFEIYILNCIFNQKNLFANENLIFLLHPIFLDYSDPKKILERDHQLLDFLIKILKKGKNYIEFNFIFLIYDLVFSPTLEMIKCDFESYPEIRKSFFLLLKELLFGFLSSILKIDLDSKKSEKNFEEVIHILIWGFKHPEKNISREALIILEVFLNDINGKKLNEYFYHKFFKQILTDLIFVMTDKVHMSNFNIQFKIFFLLIKNSKNLIEISYLKTYLNIIFGKSFPEIEKKYRNNLTNLSLIENNIQNVKEEFKKLLNMNITNNSDETSSIN
jgi:exportin-1